MKHCKIISILLVCISCITNAAVDFKNGSGYTTPLVSSTDCSGPESNEYVKVGFRTNYETNNSHFKIYKSLDPTFTTKIQVGSQINGCGTCLGRHYSVFDYGPFNSGEVWYYQAEATSNNLNKNEFYIANYTIGSPPTVLNWVSQVTTTVTVGASPADETSYIWNELSNGAQGVTISLIPTEIAKIYLEEDNHKLNFTLNGFSAILHLEVEVDGQGYTTIYNGSGVGNFIWHNSSATLQGIGLHTLKVKIIISDDPATIFHREYDVYVVPKSDNLYRDNYCNSMRVWKGNVPDNGTPLVFSEGFDSFNTKSEQYYREAGKDLINCLLDKGFNIYLVNYTLNAQSIRNNAAF